jgi:uncharacterized membrane protein
MSGPVHLWAVGYDDLDRAQRVRDLIVSMADHDQCLRLLEIALLVRSPDGSLTFNGKPFPAAKRSLGQGILAILAAFSLAVPLLSDDAVARTFDSSLPASSTPAISREFKDEIITMLRPGTAALLVLDIAENMDMILPRLRGLGGTILKTNVDLERANLIQSSLAEKPIE